MTKQKIQKLIKKMIKNVNCDLKRNRKVKNKENTNKRIKTLEVRKMGFELVRFPPYITPYTQVLTQIDHSNLSK